MGFNSGFKGLIHRIPGLGLSNQQAPSSVVFRALYQIHSLGFRGVGASVVQAIKTVRRSLELPF